MVKPRAARMMIEEVALAMDLARERVMGPSERKLMACSSSCADIGVVGVTSHLHHLCIIIHYQSRQAQVNTFQ
jgi:hypothetical protein